jgi:hypothetical protein
MENPKVLIINNPPDFGLAAGGAVEAVGRLAEETAEDSSASSWSRDWDVLEPGTKFIPPLRPRGLPQAERLATARGSPGAPARPRDAPRSALKMLRKNAPICSRRTSPMSMRCRLESNACAQ